MFKGWSSNRRGVQGDPGSVFPQLSKFGMGEQRKKLERPDPNLGEVSAGFFKVWKFLEIICLFYTDLKYRTRIETCWGKNRERVLVGWGGGEGGVHTE